MQNMSFVGLKQRVERELVISGCYCKADDCLVLQLFFLSQFLILGEPTWALHRVN